MTLIAIWHRKAERDLYAIADSRLTSSLGPLTDQAPKFFPISVTCYGPSKKNSFDVKLMDCKIGIGYAGSATVAMSTIATIQSYTASLTLKLGGVLPKLEDISNLAGRILEDNFKSFGALWGQTARCDFILFGALPLDRELKAFHVGTALTREGISGEVSELPIVREGLCCSFGSASDHFMGELRRDMETTKNFHPFNILTAILASGSRKDIGGHIQVAVATPGMVVLPHVIMPRLDRGEFDADVTFLGRDLATIGTVGDCSVGREAIGPDVATLLEMRGKAGY